ncbi:MAG: hypothetical protein ACFFFK_05965 [Candidatus Thorarchaeota archaeon]
MTKSYIEKERNNTLIVFAGFFGTFPILYISNFTLRIFVIYLQVFVPSIAALIEYVTLWHKEEPKALASKNSLIVFTLLLVIQPFVPEASIVLALFHNWMFLTPGFWLFLWGFSVSWFTGRMIVREVFFMTHKDLVV